MRKCKKIVIVLFSRGSVSLGSLSLSLSNKYSSQPQYFSLSFSMTGGSGGGAPGRESLGERAAGSA